MNAQEIVNDAIGIEDQDITETQLRASTQLKEICRKAVK